MFLCLNQTCTLSAPSKTKNIWKILHMNARTLGFRGWGYFCDQILFHRKAKFRQVEYLNT